MRIARFLSAAIMSIVALCSQAGCKNKNQDSLLIDLVVAQGNAIEHKLDDLSNKITSLENKLSEQSKKEELEPGETAQGAQKMGREHEARILTAMVDSAIEADPKTLPTLPTGNFQGSHFVFPTQQVKWAFLRELAIHYVAPRDGQSPELGYFLKGEFLPRGSPLADDLRSTLRFLIKKDKVIKAVSDWLLSKLPSALEVVPNSQSLAREWLRLLWQASFKNFADLERDAVNYEAGENYFEDNGLYVEKWWLDRWNDRGGAANGDNFIFFWQGLMVEWARALNMPDAEDWPEQMGLEVDAPPSLSDKKK